MPKQKTHKATKKRVKVTATGKILVHPTGARHVMSGKSSKKRRHMRRCRPVKASDMRRVRKSLLRPVARSPQPADADHTSQRSSET
jgi:large subunit ribosomal protein L35